MTKRCEGNKDLSFDPLATHLLIGLISLGTYESLLFGNVLNIFLG